MTEETIILKKLNEMTSDEFSSVIKRLLKKLGYMDCSDYYPGGEVHHDKIYIHSGLPILGFEASASSISVIIQLFRHDVSVSDITPLIEYVEKDDMPSEIGIVITTGKFATGAYALAVMTFHLHRFMLVDGNDLVKFIMNKEIDVSSHIKGD